MESVHFVFYKLLNIYQFLILIIRNYTKSGKLWQEDGCGKSRIWVQVELKATNLYHYTLLPAWPRKCTDLEKD